MKNTLRYFLITSKINISKEGHEKIMKDCDVYNYTTQTNYNVMNATKYTN